MAEGDRVLGPMVTEKLSEHEAVGAGVSTCPWDNFLFPEF